MGMTFTEEQQKVIDLRERNLLVSAAAGSGKTAVLVERIISKITQGENPVDIDRLLIVTFTNAAAAEMRERIGVAIEKKLSENPEDKHLQRQQTLLYNAQITTIHSFCLFVIRNYFHRIDLEPDFRIGEEGELKLLQGDVLDEVLERCYQADTPEFVQLSETLAVGKTDEKLKETILTLYHFAMSDPWPKEWLSNCVKPYEVSDLQAFEQLPLYDAMLHYLKAITEQWASLMAQAVAISQEEDGPQMYTAMLEQEQEMLEELLNCDSYQKLATVIQGMEFGRLPGARKFAGDEKKKNYVQGLRNDIKESRKKLLEQFFFLPPEEMIAQLSVNYPVIQELIRVTIAFMDAYAVKKQEKNMLDFNDMEHFALKILVEEETREPSATALELKKQFEEVMVDEYQDSNYVQETILRAVAGTQNMFMVGDVKQSIYRFRMARPELFMEKYDTYSDGDSENQKIDLHKNFRSRPEVLQSVNEIFFSIMHKDLGNVEYDKQAALYPGATFEEEENPTMFCTEVLVADPADFALTGESEDAEAIMIAGKIKQLIKEQLVTDKQTGKLRPAEYRDMVILLRGLSSHGPRMVEVLKGHGIPALAAVGTGYFSTTEVQTVLNFLRILDNPRQDIPLTAVLKSGIGQLSDEELAKIRIQYREGAFYQGVFSYAEDGEDKELQEKLKAFLSMLSELRKRIPDTPIHELLYQIMDETGYLDYVYALPGGQIRRANLEMLLEKAVAYESTSYHGLFHFIRYINQLQKYEVDFGEAEEESSENAVRLMTIHKSKGLEFPIVFVAGMGRQLNQQDIRNRMVLHPQYGIGLDITDLKRRVRMPSLTRQILARQIQMENAGEELRVLYVALTRAKEKLILTGTLKKAEEKLENYSYQQFEVFGDNEKMGFLSRLKAGCYFDWVLPPLLQKGYEVQKFSPIDLAEHAIEQGIEQQYSKEIILQLSGQVENETYQEIEGRLSYCYAYEKERSLKPKLSVSELKHRAIDRLREEETDTEYVFEEPEMMPYIPEFMRGEFLQQQQTTQQQEETDVKQEAGIQMEGMATGENIGALRGTAMHRVLECFDFSREPDTLLEQIEKMLADRRLEQRQWELVSIPSIQRFFASPLAERMKQAARAGKLYKEKPFVMGKSSNEIYEDMDSEIMILIQGIMDVFFEEDGELVLVDYKTDAVRSADELAKRYREQMNLYQDALEKATGKKVKEKILYSFKLQEIIQV